TGQIVEVELQRQPVLGLVSGPASEPRFQTKPIIRAIDLPALPSHLLQLTKWLFAYYPAPVGVMLQQLLPPALSSKQLEGWTAPAVSPLDLSSLPPLTNEQQKALQAMAETDSYLLHGKTGSGKTRLYIELAAHMVANGRSAIILTPEISLTSQLA